MVDNEKCLNWPEPRGGLALVWCLWRDQGGRRKGVRFVHLNRAWACGGGNQAKAIGGSKWTRQYLLIAIRKWSHGSNLD